MYTLSVIGLSICLVYISIIMQGAETKTCYACISDYAGAGGQCSAAKTFVECAKDCTTSGSSSAVEAIAEASLTATCAGTCDACTTTFAGEVGLDREKYCSAANAYLECAEQDCTLDKIATVELAIKAQQGCGKYS
ncbi:uncharacterized protein LOC134683503 [Mytilus trossulus]|uniref:uncharacterized protein LOC134683503 n=1 Tax=Mytilus trossulus TaxID=6551 RepID=UPI00300450A3